jgi:tetratricopeptide (TPR) repeat protein
VPTAWTSQFLVGRLRLERGEFDKAMALLQTVPPGQSAPELIRIAEAELALGKAEQARKSLLSARSSFQSFFSLPRVLGGPDHGEQSRLQLLLARAQAETGHYAQAFEALPDGSTPEHAFVKALAYLGQKQPRQALETCATQSSLDILLLRALIHLQEGNAEQARSEILSASSQNPSSPDVLLVRAQVELESAENLEEGRALLQRVFEITKQHLLRTRWVALQEPFAQDRARFKYFLVEAADVAGDEHALTLAGLVDRTVTDSSQDGRLDTIVGHWLKQKNDADGAAKAFESASDHFEQAGMTLAALRAAQEVFDLAPTGRAAVRLTELNWRVTFLDMPAPERLQYLARAKTFLDASTFPEENGSDTDGMVYYAGLVAAREAVLV